MPGRAQPLAGVKVVDFSQGVSGPFASKLMAIMGADVVKVEPPRGDSSRSQPPFLGDTPHPERSGLFLYLNTNKRGVTLDLDQPGGRAIARRLIAWADIVIDDTPPAEAAARNLSYAQVEAVNAAAVLVSTTPFGQDGPYSGYESSDLVELALGGLLYITGEPDREPLRMGGQPSAYFAGLATFSGALIALYARDATGEGQHVDVSALEGVATAQMYSGLNSEYLHVDRERMNSLAPLFAAKDGFVGVMYRQPDWTEFCTMMGRPDMITDERFRDVVSRRVHQEELNSIVGRWIAEQPKEELYHRAQRKRMPFGYICDARDLMQSAQYIERGFFQEIDHPVAGTLTYPGMPMRWGDQQWELRPAPTLGQHNIDVYHHLLGYSREDLVLLRAEQVI